MNDAKMLGAAAHGMNVTKALLSDTSSRTRKTTGRQSLSETLITVQTRVESVSVTVTRTEMTMEAYQDYIWNKIDSFPFHPTRPFDEQTVKISENCWERMKDDSEYEEKMMDIIKDGRQYPDPFFGMGSSGAYEVLEFDGDEGYHSHTWSKNFGGSKISASNRFDMESEGGFWSNRRKQIKALYKESTERYLQRKTEMQMENLHIRRMRLMAQGKYEEAASTVVMGLPASLILSGIDESSMSL